MSRTKRPPRSRRSWLFLPGAEKETLEQAVALGADVLIQELEDFVPLHRRGEARAISAGILETWRAAGAVATVRINPLESGGLDDLAAVMPGGPDAVLMAMVRSPDQVRRLDEILTELEGEFGLPVGGTEIVPNVETAAGLVQTHEIARASPRVTAALVAAEDMAADLGAERTPGCAELAYVRSRFLVDCVATGIVAVDCPYTFSDLGGAEADLRSARGLGYQAKSIVNVDQVALVNRLLTPSAEEVERAGRLVSAFEAARAEGRDRVEIDGLMAEVPTYRAAKRVLARAAELAVVRSAPP